VRPRGRLQLIGACAVLAACPPLAGCGAGGTRQHQARPPASLVARAQAGHEYPSPPPPSQSVPVASPTPVAAVAAFADAYINWTAGTVSRDMRTLAALSVGQARSAMQLAAAQTAGDYELRRGGIANSGEVEAIARLRGSRDQYVVVTRELTTATATTSYQGLRPAWHVAIATVARTSTGLWVLSGWQPES
jgi:hypothetical protein